MGAQLLFPPVVGLANNGDFGKIIGAFGFGASAQDEFKFAPVTYIFSPAYRFSMGYRSTEHVLAAAAVALNRLFSPPGIFDLRAIGIVHGALALAALALLRLRSIVLALAILLIFGDVMYAAALNSFYMDTAAYAFFLLAVAFYIRRQGWWLLATAIGLVMSKPVHAVMAIPIAALLLIDGSRLGLKSWRALVAAGLMLAAAPISWRSAPAGYSSTGLFSMINFRLLPASTDVDSDLRLLGLNDSYRRCIGQHAFVADGCFADAAVREDFARRTSPARIGWLYVHHPRSAWRELIASLDQAGRQRPHMGNFDRVYGRPEFAESRSFALWSDLKKRLFERHGAAYFFALLALTAVAIALAWREEARAGMIALIVMMWLELLISAYGDAIDIARHFFMTHAMEDALLVSAVALCVKRKYHRRVFADIYARLPQHPFQSLAEKVFAPHYRFINAQAFVDVIDPAAQNPLPLGVGFREMFFAQRRQDVHRR